MILGVSLILNYVLLYQEGYLYVVNKKKSLRHFNVVKTP